MLDYFHSQFMLELCQSLTVVEKIFVRDVDDVIRMEMSLMRLNITLANQDLSAVVNVAVALKRKAYLYGSYAYGAPPDNRIVNILFDFSK